MSSFRVDYDSWPWNGHREQAREDARYDRKDRDLYDPYDGEHKRAYVEEFNRETRRIEDQRREEREERDRLERRAREEMMERQRRENYEREMAEREPEPDEEEAPHE